MKPSKELQTQLTRLADQGSFHLSNPLKVELQRLAKHLGARELINFDCGTCQRDTLNSVNDILRRQQTKPVLQKRMSMVIKPEDLKWGDLKTFAKAKGVKTYKKNKEQILKELNEL